MPLPELYSSLPLEETRRNAGPNPMMKGRNTSPDYGGSSTQLHAYRLVLLDWIGSMVFANYSIYMATIDYMICAYGPYSASASGGSEWSRDFLAGVLTIPATPFFSSEL
jgi:hypothetical protein